MANFTQQQNPIISMATTNDRKNKQQNPIINMDTINEGWRGHSPSFVKMSCNENLTILGIDMANGIMAVILNFAGYALDNAANSTFSYVDEVYAEKYNLAWIKHRWIFCIIYTFFTIVLNVLVIFSKHNHKKKHQKKNITSMKNNSELTSNINEGDFNSKDEHIETIQGIDELLFDVSLVQMIENDNLIKDDTLKDNINQIYNNPDHRFKSKHEILNSVFEETEDLWDFVVVQYGITLISCTWVVWIYIFMTSIYITIGYLYVEGTYGNMIGMWIRFSIIILAFIIILVYLVHTERNDAKKRKFK